MTKAIPKIGEVMTPFPYAIALDQHVGDAQRMMSGHGIRHLPVTSDGEVYSVITERDISAALGRPDADPWTLQVSDVCVTDPYIVDVEEPLDNVLEEMAERRIGCAVVAKDERVAGVFTNVDVCRLYAASLRGG